MADKNLEYLTDFTPGDSGSGAGESPTVSHSFTESSIINFTTLVPLLTTQSSWLTSVGLGFCEAQWLPINHVVFQIANVFFFLSYLSPPGIHGLLFMRICLMLASLFLALWGGIILCAFDMFVWNAIFTFLNFVQVGIILYILRPVRFRSDLESVYVELFKPLRVSRHQFKKTVKCMREICVLKPREAFCIEKVTRADRLTLVLSGRLLVSQAGHTLHVIEKHQFVDSPEWFGVTSEEFYQTTILALEECRLLVWNRDKLRLTISDDQFLQTVLDNILGKDVVKKLLLVTETSCNGSTSTHTNVNESEVNSETTKLLQESKLISREIILSQQIDENPNSNVWNLTNIVEDPRDTETTV